MSEIKPGDTVKRLNGSPMKGRVNVIYGSIDGYDRTEVSWWVCKEGSLENKVFLRTSIIKVASLLKVEG